MNLYGAFAGAVALAIMGIGPAIAGEADTKRNLPPAISASELSDLTGGANPNTMAITTQTLSALNSGNSVNANSVTSGNIALDANAFSGFSGVGNFVFNTGNNNNLQGSLSIQILTPMPN